MSLSGVDNKFMENAKRKKKDEFYTQLEDIELELKNYRDHFKGKSVLCNCDDPYESNFFKYFAMNFNFLGLKKLIATCYATSPIIYTQLSLFDLEEVVSMDYEGKKPYKIVITEVKDLNEDGAVDLADVEYLIKNKKNTLTLLKGDGDFRSDECIELMKEVDIVVTNPPFSLFREYVAQLIEYNKQFLIIGNINAVTYKEIFPLLKNNKMWIGESIRGSGRTFMVPKDYPFADGATYKVDEKGNKYIRVRGVRWFTNLDYPKRHEDLLIYKTYNDNDYPKYDNYNAIEVSEVTNIPCDYYGVMGVPITFIDKYNPEQFEILGITDRQNTSGLRTKKYTEKDSPKYNDLNARSVLKLDTGYKPQYARILIRRK